MEHHILSALCEITNSSNNLKKEAAFHPISVGRKLSLFPSVSNNKIMSEWLRD